MNFNLPPKVRFGIYVLLGLGSIVEVYLLATGVIGINEDIAWKAFSAFCGGLAALNTTDGKNTVVENINNKLKG